MLCVQRRRLKGHVITAFKYVKGCSKEKCNSCSLRPLGIKQEIIGLNCTEGDQSVNVLPDASRYGWLSTGTDNPGMLWGFSHCQAGEGKVKELLSRAVQLQGVMLLRALTGCSTFNLEPEPSASSLPDASKETPRRGLCGAAEQFGQHQRPCGCISGLQHGYRKDNSLHIPGQVLRTETKFSEAEKSDVSAQGCRVTPSPHPHLWELFAEHHFLIKNDHCKS